MCGIAGIIQKNEAVCEALDRAYSVQKHRGPDANGTSTYKVNQWNIGMAHQRLSIIDLSELGNQPMISFDGNDIIIYNGEIYNYKELRVELEKRGCHFVSDSDTEVILFALKHWGSEKALQKFNGMWAFAWLDLNRKKLVLSRDRFGVKPLYYYISDDSLYFASEIKTILDMTREKFGLNYQKVGEYLNQSLLDSTEDTFFYGIQKIPASQYIEVDLSKEKVKFEASTYWQHNENANRDFNETELIEKVRTLFFDAVRLRLRSDVPLGLLLSGGVDSSAIASAVRYINGSSADLRLISAVSKDKRFDESYFIDKMGEYLESDVTKVLLDFRADRLINYIEDVTWANDEPIASVSNVAHYMLMEKAKELGVTVILSGQGADELLCGYRKYLGFYLKSLVDTRQYSKALMVTSQFLRNNTIINQFNLGEARRYLPSFLNKRQISITGSVLDSYNKIFLGLSKGQSISSRQLIDIYNYSVPALVHYEDRMSMAWSREIRVPFLDYRLVELFVNLPAEIKIRNGWTKYIFRKAMEDYLPHEIVWRKDKQGFVNPQGEWLKNEIKEDVLKYFEGDSIMFRSKIIDPKNLMLLYDKYCNQPTGKGSVWFRDVFNPLALEIWLRRFEQYIKF